MRSTIFAKILASRGAFAAAAAARRTLGAPAFCIRVTWCTACRPPGMVNYNSKNRFTQGSFHISMSNFITQGK